MNTATKYLQQSARDLTYTSAVLAWSIVGFNVWVAGVSVTASVLVLVVGVFVWMGFAYLMRATTSVDRRLAGWIRHEPVDVEYRASRPGVLARLRTITTDPQTWREFGWMALNSVVGFVLGILVLTALGIALAYVTLPVWYWAISNPADQYGLTNVGLFTVDTLGEAFAMMAAGLALIPLVMLIARGAAAGHSALAARVLTTR
jgi:hypothetical protein